MSVKEIMQRNIDQVTDKDGTYQPSDALLDEIWAYAVEATGNRGMLMSDVINGDAAIDSLLIDFARDGGIGCALDLRNRTQRLFRTYAYSLAEEYEYDAMAAINPPPEPEFDDGIPF